MGQEAQVAFCHLGDTPKLECTGLPKVVYMEPKFLWLSR